MSLSYQKLEAVEVRPPQLILQNKRAYAVMKGPKQTTLKQWTSSSVSNSNITFSMPPPSPEIIVDRRLNLYVPFRLTMTAVSTAIGQTVLNINSDAPRCFPLSSAIDTMSCTINNSTMTVNLADIVQPLLRYNTDNLIKNHLYSTSFSYPDQSAKYSQLSGNIRSPLHGYGDSNDENTQGRGGHANYKIVSNQVSTSIGQTLTAVVDLCAMEPLFCMSPFYWDNKDHPGFIHVNSMDLTVNFLSQAANRLWSRSDTALTLTSLSYVVGGSSTNNGPSSFLDTTGNVPYVLATYYTPRESDVIPRNMPFTYPFFEIQRYSTDMGVIDPNGTFLNVASNSIQLNTIPRKIYIFVRERNQDLFSSPTKTDTFLQLKNINLTYQNVNGIFSSGNMLQLYQISRRNKCSLSWTQWTGESVYQGNYTDSIQTVGSIFCAEFGLDIPLNSDLDAPGKISPTTLTVTVTGKNTTSTALNCSLYVIPVLEGTFTIEGIGRARQEIGVLTSKDILDAKTKPYLSYEDVQEVNGGGDFMSGLKEFFGNVNTFLKDNRVISSVMSAFPLTAPFAPIAHKLGYGEGEEEDGGVLAGEGVLLDEFGGAYMPRRKLKSDMKRRVRM
jgi:hypothetical protein